MGAGKPLGIEPRAFRAGVSTLAIDTAVWETSNLEEEIEQWWGRGKKEQDELSEAV